jgi:hypothetical protein
MDLTRGNSYANLVNHPTSAGCIAQVPDSVRVVPCDPMASMLWRKTRPDDSRCGRPMPLGSGWVSTGQRRSEHARHRPARLASRSPRAHVWFRARRLATSLSGGQAGRCCRSGEAAERTCRA